MIDQPKEERKTEAEDEAGNDGEIEGGVFAAIDDVAGESPQAEGEFSAKVEESTDENEETAEKKERAAEFAEGVHEESVEENAGNGSKEVRKEARRRNCGTILRQAQDKLYRAPTSSDSRGA